MAIRSKKFRLPKTKFIFLAWLVVAIFLFSMIDEILEPRSHVVEYIGGRTRDATFHGSEFVLESGSFYLVFDSTEDPAPTPTTVEGGIYPQRYPGKELNEILAVDSKLFYPFNVPNGVTYNVQLSIRTSNPVSSYFIHSSDREYLEGSDNSYVIQNVLILVFSVLSLYMGYILLIFISKTTKKKIPFVPLKIEKMQKQRYIPNSEYYTLITDLDYNEDILIASHCELYQIESNEIGIPLKSITKDTRWNFYSGGILILTNQRIELIKSKQAFSLSLSAIKGFDVFQPPELDSGLLIEKSGESVELFIVNDALQWKDFMSAQEQDASEVDVVTSSKEFCIACGTENEGEQDTCTKCGEPLLKN